MPDKKELQEFIWNNNKHVIEHDWIHNLEYVLVILQTLNDSLKEKESIVGWWIILITSFNSFLTLFDLEKLGTNSHFNLNYTWAKSVALSVLSITTTLLASWTKKKGFIKRIKEIDKRTFTIEALLCKIWAEIKLPVNDRLEYVKFYKTFTGTEPSEELKSFSQIPLSDFSKDPICDGTAVEPDDINEKMFVEFANQIKDMLQNTNKKYQDLLKILKQIFTIEGDEVYIHSELNSDKLNEISKEARSIIVNLYIDCEKDYRKGIEAYNKIKETLQTKNGKKIEEQIENNIEEKMTSI